MIECGEMDVALQKIVIITPSVDDRLLRPLSTVRGFIWSHNES